MDGWMNKLGTSFTISLSIFYPNIFFLFFFLKLEEHRFRSRVWLSTFIVSPLRGQTTWYVHLLFTLDEVRIANRFDQLTDPSQFHGQFNTENWQQNVQMDLSNLNDSFLVLSFFHQQQNLP